MARSVFAIVIGNLASKGLGLVREVLFAAWFGTGEIAAAFRVAQTGYLLPTQALVGDALSAGLLPLYRRFSSAERDQGRLLLLIACLYGLLFSATVSGLLFMYAGAVAAFIAPGASGTTLALAAKLLQVMGLATPFFVLGGTISFIEASFGSYGGIAWRPVLLNVGAILGAALAVWTDHTHWLASTIVASHVVFFMWTVLELRKLDRLLPEVRPTLGVISEVSRSFLRNMLPLLGLPLIAQINVLVERIVSSWIGTEVIPAVDYARFVADTTVQLIAVPLGILTMSKHGGEDPQAMQAHVRQTTTTILLVAFPLSVFIAQHAESVVRLLFARGAFDAHSVLLTTEVLRWMGGALGATITAYYLVKVLNSQLRNREALLVTLLAASGNMLVNLLLWRHLGALTIGAAVASFNLILFLACFTRLDLWRPLAGHLGWIALGCSIQLAFSAWLASELLHPFGMLATASACALWWCLLIGLVPALRNAATPLLRRVPGLRRLASDQPPR